MSPLIRSFWSETRITISISITLTIICTIVASVAKVAQVSRFLFEYLRAMCVGVCVCVRSCRAA